MLKRQPALHINSPLAQEIGPLHKKGWRGRPNSLSQDRSTSHSRGADAKRNENGATDPHLLAALLGWGHSDHDGHPARSWTRGDWTHFPCRPGSLHRYWAGSPREAPPTLTCSPEIPPGWPPTSSPP